MDIRVRKFFTAWYQPNYHMDKEDWIFVGITLVASLWAFNLGLLIGWIWTKLI